MKLLRIVIEVIPEINLPQQRGRPFVYSPRVMICCFLVMVIKGFSKRGLYAFLTREDDIQAVIVRKTIPFPEKKIPDRRTFDRRLSNWILPIQLYLLEGMMILTRRARIGLSRLTTDNRMFPAHGNIWHRKDQKLGVIPQGLRNIDQLAGWGVSAYRGWVFGHGLDVIVTTGKLVVPILAVARSLVIRGNTALKQIVSLLPTVKQGVLAADGEYDDGKLEALIGQTGRSFHVANRHNPTKKPNSKTYRKRKTTVEPFFERFLQAMLARGKLPFKGKQAWGWLMTATFLYQLAIIYQVLNHHPHPMQVTHLIRTL